MENTPKTDTEIIETLAREVMGWIVIDQHTPLRLAVPYGGYICDGTPKRHDRGICFERWNPLESIADAWMIRAKMESLGWLSNDDLTYFGWSSDKAHPYGYSIWFSKWPERHEPDAGVPRKFHSHVRDFNNAPRAICLAALSAIRSTDQQKGAGQ